MSSHWSLARGLPRDELVAVLAILRSAAISPSKLSGLLDYVGSAVDLLPVRTGGADIGERPLLLEGITPSVLEAAEHEVSEWEAAGHDVRTVLDPGYPTNLQALFDKPPLIFVQGYWADPVDSRAVAVVGTRAASKDGCKRAFRLAGRLAEGGVTVISGMARGIDTCAHRGALRAGGRTIAVMGTGIGRRYPPENAGLADQILSSDGALVSQFFPAQHPTRWTFPVRNVTMSGLAVATVVVEAGATSGAKMQAEAALTRGRAVFLPNSLVEAHEWARRMVEQGYKGAHATLVGSADEVIDRLDLSSAVGSLVA
jgi:DNA processing protein